VSDNFLNNNEILDSRETCYGFRSSVSDPFLAGGPAISSARAAPCAGPEPGPVAQSDTWLARAPRPPRAS
jgi:hypothetical protein